MLLAIDEINRGNCAQIFGDMFQLLDRDAEGWSQYAIDLSDLHRAALETELERLGKTLADLPESRRLGRRQGHSPHRCGCRPSSR